MECPPLPPTGEPSLGDLPLRVLDHISAMVAYWDTDQRCRFANQAYLHWFGRSRGEILGITMRELLGPIYPLNLPYILGALRGEPQVFERAIPTPSGVVRHSIANYTPDIVEGVVRGFFVHVADVSPLKAAQEEMRKAHREAEEASQAKSAFLAHMSHEIRTPMNAILGLTQIISHTQLNPQQADYLRKLAVAGRHLLGIIDDILDSSKIEAGKLVLSRREFSLDDLLDELASLVVATTDKAGIEIVFLITPDAPRRLLGDGGRLRQVLINLIRNAVRFTDHGEIELSIGCEGFETDGVVRLHFLVRDTGIGIPAEQLERIFEGFNQADATSSRNAGGTGLGLAISRKLVRLMGGELRVDSSPGRGSTFYFSIPLAQAAPQRSPVRAQDEETQRLIAACTSSLISRFLSESCRALGWQCTVCGDAAEAAERIEAAAVLGRPFAALLINWPLEDDRGTALPQLLAQAHGRHGMGTLFLVQSLVADSLPAALGREHIDKVIGKPATPAVLYQAVTETLLRRADPQREMRLPARAAQGEVLVSPRLPGVHLLLVDDNPINLEVARELFTREGCHVTTVNSGHEALASLQAAPVPFDAVLMDVQMPELDGYQTTRRIRAEPRWALLPIVAVSAGVLWEERDRCRAVGMNGFISKPIEIDEAVLLIGPLLAAAQARPGAARETAAQGPVHPAVADPRSLFDLSAAIGVEAASALPVAALLKLFLEDNVALLSNTRAGIQRGDRAGTARALHRLRGTAGVLGAKRLTDAAQALELQLSKPGMPDVEPQTAEFELALKEALSAAHSFLTQRP